MRIVRAQETPQQAEQRKTLNKERMAGQRTSQHPKQDARDRSKSATQMKSSRSRGQHFIKAQPHRLGPMNDECSGCGALHWGEERTKNHKGTYNDCCRHNKVLLPHIPPTTPLLLELFNGFLYI